jgi:hemoglobin-like flavoprotein
VAARQVNRSCADVDAGSPHTLESPEMDKIRLHRLRVSFESFRPCGPAMVAMVMRRLGDRRPGIRALFPEDTSRLNARLFDTLRQIVKRADRFHSLEAGLMELGGRALAAGANTAHYGLVRDEVLVVMAELAGEDWTESLQEDWTLLLDAISGAMLRGGVAAAA